MPEKQKKFGWAVFYTSLGAYVPILVGGWQHPSEINVACFGLWVILAAMITYSSKVQHYSGWKMQFGFFFGNVGIVAFALIRGGYTFNLGPTETIVFYGIASTICLWVAVGLTLKKWDPGILYLGGIIADVLSFYPQLKQYLLPHERPTTWMIVGWVLFAVGSIINILFVEKLPKKLFTVHNEYKAVYGVEKNYRDILKESAFSLENCILISITIAIMCR